MSIELDNTEEKIVKATFLILQKEGIEKTTTKKIAAEAGVNEVTIFRKFENKKNLIDISKKYFMEILIQKLENIFDFSDDDEIDEYLKRNFDGFLNLKEKDLYIISIALREVKDVSGRRMLISSIIDPILDKLEKFFKLQIKKGIIRDINPRILAIMCFSSIFQSVILCKVYDIEPSVETEKLSLDFLDILFNGIKIK